MSNGVTCRAHIHTHTHTYSEKTEEDLLYFNLFWFYSVYWDIRTPVIPDSWPVRTWIQLTDVFSYINVISIADSRHWHLRTRKSGENRLKMTQKWPKTTQKKTKLVNFFYRLFPLVTNRYHPTDCFELAMLPAGKYSHGKLWNSGEDFLGTYTRCH